MEHQPIHTTENELKFLSHLRPAVIEKYLVALSKRRRWDNLDSAAISDYCQKLIDQHKEKQNARETVLSDQKTPLVQGRKVPLVQAASAKAQAEAQPSTTITRD